MFRIAVKGALARKLRLLGTALSVILGVAFLAGTLVFTDTIKRTFDDLFADIYENTDSYVRSSASVDLDFGETQRGRIDESILQTVLDVPGVAAAEGSVQGFAQLVDADGDVVGDPGQGPPTFGMNYIEGELGAWKLTEGSRPPGEGEIVVDKGSADDAGFALGDTVTVLTQTGPHELTLVGTARFGTVDSPGGASVSLLDLDTAQDLLLGGSRELDAVVAAAKPGVGGTELTARISDVLPDGTEAITGAEITEESQDQIGETLGFFNTFLLVFAAVGLVVACFTIYNTFQIVITQRRREMALLRSIGGTRRQVLGAQLMEAVIIGVVASLVGLAAGVVVATLLKRLMDAFGIDIPAGGTVFTARTAIVSMVVGIVVTTVAAVFPSVRASRVPPLAAIRDVAADTAGRTRNRLAAGGLITALGMLGFGAGLISGELIWVGVGALFTLVGAFVLGPLLARPVASGVGTPLVAMTGITGSLARENAKRNPKRTSRTGGALMVGVALVATITIIAASVKDWTRDIFGEHFTGDYVVSTDSFGFGGLSTQLAAELNDFPEVGAATGIRLGAAHDVDDGSDMRYIAVDPQTAPTVFDIGMLEGRVEDLTNGGILVDDGTADDHEVAVGDTVTFQFLDGVTRRLDVEGIYTEDDLAGPYVISHELHEQSGSDQFDFAVYIALAEGVSERDAEVAIEPIAAEYPNADFESRDEYIDTQAAQFDPIVNLMYGLLGLAVIIALLNIANSMVLSTHERTRELGLLRAVGMTRRQTRSSVTWEAAIIAVLGTAMGLLVGVFFGWAISVTIRNEGLDAFSLPIQPLVVVAVAAVVGAIVAAVRPAWRAARLDVLQAIAHE